MLKSILCDYREAYILVKRTITIKGVGSDATARQADEKINKTSTTQKLYTSYRLYMISN